jgi:hypothetical protein
MQSSDHKLLMLLSLVCRLFSRSGVNVNSEALRIKMEVQRRLHGELEVHTSYIVTCML